MVTPEVARTIVGVIGNFISMGLFLSPVSTFVSIYKNKSVQNYKPHPYFATILNCAMWMFYGMPFVHPDSTLVVTINGSGFVLEAIYIAMFLIYSPPARTKKLVLLLIGEIAFAATIIGCTLHFVHGTKGRTIVVGAICVAFTIGMYAAPLSVMRMVIRTKSVKYMPFWLSLANLCNGGVWLAYALIKFDPWIMIPNGIGMVSGIVQLGLYALYYKSTNWEKSASDVEMASV